MICKETGAVEGHSAEHLIQQSGGFIVLSSFANMIFGSRTITGF